MARFKDDFYKTSKGMGLRYGIELILFPRLKSKFCCKTNSFNKAIDRFISNKFNDILKKYHTCDTFINSPANIPNVIWVFWWQGIDAMPSVIKECYNSVLRNANGREVRLLTRGNYEEYVQLPPHILEKFRAGIISYPHFSDILRVALLKDYGGMWIDAATFVTKPIPQYYGLFYSPKLSMIPQDSPHLHLWVISVMGAPSGMPLFSFLYDILIKYWHKYDTDYTYLMFDYFIRYGYEHFLWLKDLIDNRPIDSPDFYWSRYNFTQEVDETRLNELIDNNTFISLTYRIQYPMQAENGRDTYYAALLKIYNLSNAD